MERISESLLGSLRSLQNIRYWMLAITAGCIAIHITLVWQTDDSSFLGVTLLFWGAIASLLWGRRHSLTFESSGLASLAGFLILGVVLLKCISVTGHFLRVTPFLFGVGLILLASGFKGFRQYWKELTLSFFLGGHEVLLYFFIEFSELTARLSTFLLWCLGLDVYRQGVNIHLPGGSVAVYSACSGLSLIAQLTGVAVLFLMTLYTQWSWLKGLLITLFAAGLAFFMNGIRVALMAVFVASGNPETFDYWHAGQGSSLFSLFTVLIFLGICWRLTCQTGTNSSQSTEA
ncbi:MAG: cyanoexosortase A [Leptolyngbyaceae cyanobacterium MO_188.B28]|nr:cyanoexosortase A [Leptolyngbyaceae cyanobacterium MO_188.B28]